MANVVTSPRARETGLLRLDTAADNIIIGIIRIQLIIFEPNEFADVCQIENSNEDIKFILTAQEQGTGANEGLPTIVIPFPFGFRIDGISLGTLTTGGLVTIVYA